MRIVLSVLILLVSTAIARAARTIRTEHSSNDPIVRSFYDALPPILVENLIEESYHVKNYVTSLPPMLNGKYRTFWLPFSKLTAIPLSISNSFEFDPSRSAIEQAISLLRDYALPGRKVIGAEWWFQVVDGNEKGKIGWHVDKDESIASNQMYLSHPELASILYLTREGGPTCITDQWSPNGNEYSPFTPHHTVLSFPKPNKYTIFHGELVHGVLPGQSQPPRDASSMLTEQTPPIHPVYAAEKAGRHRPRITFLINWWTYKPEEPNCVELEIPQIPFFQQVFSRRITESQSITNFTAVCPSSQQNFHKKELSGFDFQNFTHLTAPMTNINRITKNAVSDRWFDLTDAATEAYSPTISSTPSVSGIIPIRALGKEIIVKNQVVGSSSSGRDLSVVLYYYGRRRTINEAVVVPTEFFEGETIHLLYVKTAVEREILRQQSRFVKSSGERNSKKEKKPKVQLTKEELRRNRAQRDKKFM